jgi:uncharacterized protein YqeY
MEMALEVQANKIADKYQYNLPYTRKDVIAIYEEGYRQALADVLELTNGEVINGTLEEMICAQKVKELQK